MISATGSLTCSKVSEDQKLIYAVADDKNWVALSTKSCVSAAEAPDIGMWDLVSSEGAYNVTLYNFTQSCSVFI